MGYAMPTQIGKGIHLRQYSRAFIFADKDKKSRVVFVNIDACMGTQIMKMQVRFGSAMLLFCSTNQTSSLHFLCRSGTMK